MMNGCQRIQAALAGEMPDRRPVMLHNFMPAARQAGYTMRQYRSDPRIAAECHIRFVERYGVDGILFDVDTALLAGSIGVPVDFPEDEPARTHEQFLHAYDDLDRLQEADISTDLRIQHSLETMRLLRNYFGDEIYLRGNCDQAPFSLATSIRTPEAFMMDLLTCPEQAVRLLDYAAGVSEQFVALMAATGVHMVSNGDSPAGPSMISPTMYGEFAAPYEARLADAARRAGVAYLLHICGDTSLILDQMAQLPLDAVELDYLTPADEIYAEIGDRITLFGTVDPSGVMALGTPADVERETLKLLELYRDNSRLVIGAGCALPPATPDANIRALIDAARNF